MARIAGKLTDSCEAAQQLTDREVDLVDGDKSHGDGPCPCEERAVADAESQGG